MEKKDNITRLLEMLDHPETYSEQEIRDIINQDEETRAAYRTMVAARQGYRSRRPAPSSAEAEAAWQRFEQRHWPMTRKPAPRRWMRIAASFAVCVLVAGIAWAAVQMVRDHESQEGTGTVASAHECALANLTADTVTVQPVIYDNVALESMLPEIARHYGVTVEFSNDTVRQLRFHFVWDSGQGLDKVVDNLNHFERVRVKYMMEDKRLIVK